MPVAPRDVSRSSDSVIVVIPCLNEEEHIERTLAHFMAEFPNTVCKIIVSDGGSTDNTVKIIEECAHRDSRVVLLRNTRRIQSSALNMAVEQYGDLARFIVRADSHADYPSGFCTTLLAAQRMTGADSVVVSMIAKGINCFQRAAAAAQNSRLGNGGSAHRRLAQGRFVDHGHHALMDVSAFRLVGGYDETFSHNEDAELDRRLIIAGYRIYLCADADIIYYPRKNPFSLFKQYKNFGRGRAKTILKHRAKPRLRQLMPIMVGPAVVMSLLWPLSPFFAAPALLWAITGLTFGALLGARSKSICVCGAGITAMLMHLGFSFGFISQFLWSKAMGSSQSKRSAQSAAP
jgi:succinoglycan biosynthesis protein ExoA